MSDLNDVGSTTKLAPMLILPANGVSEFVRLGVDNLLVQRTEALVLDDAIDSVGKRLEQIFDAGDLAGAIDAEGQGFTFGNLFVPFTRWRRSSIPWSLLNFVERMWATSNSPTSD